MKILHILQNIYVVKILPAKSLNLFFFNSKLYGFAEFKSQGASGGHDNLPAQNSTSWHLIQKFAESLKECGFDLIGSGLDTDYAPACDPTIPWSHRSLFLRSLVQH